MTMVMPAHASNWQLSGKRAAGLLLQALLTGALVLSFAEAARGQECLYVLSRLRGTVDAFARPDLTLEAAVALPDCPLSPPTCMPTALAVDPARRRVYVSRQDTGVVQILDMNGIEPPVSLTAGTAPADLVLTPDRSRLLVANLASDTVSVISTSTDTVIDTIPVGDAPRGLALLPDGSRAFVANSGSGMNPAWSISVIDLGTLAVVDTWDLPAAPAALAVSPDAMRLYASLNNGTIAVFTLPQGPPPRSVAVGTRPRGIAFVPDGSRAYVTNSLDNTLTPIDTTSETAEAAIPVGSAPLDIVITDDGATAYVVDSGGDNTLSVISLPDGPVTTRGEQFAPFDLALGSCPLLPTPTPTVTTSPQPTGTPPVAACAGDCDGDATVSINELITGVNIALGNSPASACPAFDGNGDGEVAINELIAAVNVALAGC